MIKLGKFQVNEYRGITAHNCQQFLLSSSHKKGQRLQFTATIRLLSTHQLQKIRRGQILQLLDTSRFIEEVFYVSSHDRIFMIAVFSSTRSKGDAGLPDLQLSEIECLEALGEALLLISQLHQAGIRLAEPLQKYIQLQMEKTQQLSRLSTIRIKKYQDHPVLYQPNNQQGDLQLLSQHQINLLRSYCSLLEKCSTNIRDNPKWKQFQQLLAQLQTEISGVNLRIIMNALFIYQIQQNDLILYCLFYPQEQMLIVQFVEKSSNKMFIYEEETYVRTKSNSHILNRILFYTLASIKLNQIKLLSSSHISFQSISQDSWIEVMFQGKEKHQWSNLAVFDMPDILYPKKMDVKGFQERKQGQQKIISGTDNLLQIQMQEAEYPFNCVVRVISSYQIQAGKPQQTQGVGFLVKNNLVVTCAHLLYPKINHGYYRVIKVEVVAGDRMVQVAGYRFEHKFIEYRCRENDYALLHLKYKVILPRYLQIAMNYRTDNKIGIMKLQQKHSLSIVSLRYQNDPIKINNHPQFEHSFKTKPGDSGSPIIVQFQQLPHFYYVIAIHSSQMGLTKLSTKLNKQIVEKLVFFEKELTNDRISAIQILSIEYQGLIEKLRKREEESQEQFRQKPQLQQQLKAKRQQRNRQILRGSNGLTLLRRCLYRKQQQLQQKYLSFTNKYGAFRSRGKESKTQQKEKKDLLQELETYKQNYLLPLQTDQQAQRDLQAVDGWIQHLKNGQRSKRDYVQKWYNDVCDHYQSYKYFGFNWESMAVFYKHKQYRENYKDQALFICKDADMTKTLNQLGRIKGVQQTHTLKTSYFVSTINQTMSNLKLNDAHLKIFAGCPISPFNSFRCNGYYQFNNANLYEYQYTVQVESEQQLFDFCWQQIRFSDKSYPLAYLNRIIEDQRSNYALDIKLKTHINSSLDSFLSSITQDKYFVTLILLLTYVADFVCSLHSQGLLLCAPLEYSLLARDNPLQPSSFYRQFIYFGHPSALCLKVKQLLKLENPSEEVVKEVHEYYPVEEILAQGEKRENNKYDPVAFRKIDVWMLGKAFSRFLQQAPSSQCQIFGQFTSLLTNYGLMVSAMTCEADERCSIEDVKDLLWAMDDRWAIQIKRLKMMKGLL